MTLRSDERRRRLSPELAPCDYLNEMGAQEPLVERRQADRRTTAKLRCPTCGDPEGISAVLDTRRHPYRDTIWRRRLCSHCGTTVETGESIEVVRAADPPAPTAQTS